MLRSPRMLHCTLPSSQSSDIPTGNLCFMLFPVFISVDSPSSKWLVRSGDSLNANSEPFASLSSEVRSILFCRVAHIVICSNSVTGVYSLSPQCGNFQTSLQDRVFMGVGMFSCSWEMLFKVWLCKSNFQSTSKQLSDVLWDHLELCTHSVYILCSQPVQNQLTSKKSTVIFLNILCISNVINS